MERLFVIVKLVVLILSLVTVFGASFCGTLATLGTRDLFASSLMDGCVVMLLGALSLFVIVWRSL